MVRINKTHQNRYCECHLEQSYSATNKCQKRRQPILALLSFLCPVTFTKPQTSATRRIVSACELGSGHNNRICLIKYPHHRVETPSRAHLYGARARSSSTAHNPRTHAHITPSPSVHTRP
uniref:Uncharacterized protein n=1 Tax=Trypanosoma vivax (strain Y486) TaxID=1055687 RepID=G0U165_TRYVY|nr:hypothetical protein, unlikely [Trypanosoma vivax Y486]